MSTTRKILTVIFSVILIGALAFLITWGILNWSKVKEGMKGNGLYTQEDINNAYQDGYNTALTDKDEYDNLINEYRDTITTLVDNISQLNSEIATLTRNNNSLELQITNLNLLREDLEAQVKELQANETANEATITELNRQIIILNTEISTLTAQVQNHNAIVSTLNKTIADLQASIEYYEQYIATLESGDSVVATFEFDGKVYSIQVVAKGSTVTIADPQSTEGVIFNGWTVDGRPVTLSEYPLYKNTKFVADVAYKYVVKFTVDGVVKSTQLVDKGQYVTTPTSPKKANYTFKYWTLDGNLEVELDKYPITCDTTFIAKFARLYTVSFQYEDGTEIVSRRIEEGTTTNPARITDLPNGAVLNGWKLNGYFVDVSSYAIYQDTVFVADISYTHTVTFKNGDLTVLTIQVQDGGYASAPAISDNRFEGWTLDGDTIVDVSTYKITSDTVFIAKLRDGSLDDFKATTVKGKEGANSIEIAVAGLKVGDKFKVVFDHLFAQIPSSSMSYTYNSPDSPVPSYGYDYTANGWVTREHSGVSGRYGTLELTNDMPFTAKLGYYAHIGVDVVKPAQNDFTLTVSCRRDGYLTISWSDYAGFYIAEAGISALQLVR